MGRLETCGFEFQEFLSAQDESPNFVVSATAPVVETGTTRTGAAAMKIASANQYARWTIATPDIARTYYLRAYVNFSGAPGAVIRVLNALDTAGTPATAVSVRTASSGTTLALFNTGNTQVGSASGTLTAGQWYRVELKIKVVDSTHGVAELLIDGVSIASTAVGSFGSTAIGQMRVGNNAGNTPTNPLYVDDVGLNDDQGASQNDYPGPGKVLFLKPISDVPGGRVGWITLAGGTSNLWDEVDNTPIAVGSHSIRDTNNNATDTYDANLTTYSSGGIAAGDAIMATQALAIFLNSSATGRLGGVVQQSNPSSTEGTASVTNATKVVRDTIQYAPSVTLGSSPVIRIRKGTASTDTLTCFLIGLYVEYRPPIQVTLTAATETGAAQALTHQKQRSVAAAAETDAAQALSVTHVHYRTVTPAVETGSAQALTRGKRAVLSPSAEVDSAVAISHRKTASIASAGETDAAQALHGAKRVSITSAAETDAARTLSFTQTHSRSLTPATEADAAQALTVRKRATLTPATEADAAQTLRIHKTVPLGPATEADAAQSLTFHRVIRVTLTPAAETNAAVSLKAVKRSSIVAAVETGTAAPSTQGKRLSIAPASETDVAWALRAVKARSAVAAIETDTAVGLGITHLHYRVLTPTTETDHAVALSVTKTGAATEVFGRAVGMGEAELDTVSLGSAEIGTASI